MSSVQHKLLNFEVTPPEGAWQKIADELDDAGAGFQFPNKLRELSITRVPGGIWEKIAAELDDAGSGFQFPYQLQELAVDAPAGVWGKIDRMLEGEELDGSAAEKLYAAAVVPPAAAWNKIETTLDTLPGETVPERRRILPFWKYAAAAAILGFLAFGSLQLFQPAKTDANTATGNKKIPSIEALSHATAGVEAATDKEDNTTDISADNPEAREDAALEASKKTYAKLNLSTMKKADIAAAFRFDDYISPDDINAHSSSGYEEALTQDEASADRYIVLMTPDGHFIRVSKKLSKLVCCVSGEEQDKDCRSMVDAWRKQLACSDASHPGNFMDILSLVSSLQDQ